MIQTTSTLGGTPTTSKLAGTPTTSNLAGTPTTVAEAPIPTMVAVSSSWVHSIGYNRGSLFVQFKDKKGALTVLARYEDIPESWWYAFQAAPSKGTFVHESGLYRWPYKPVG